MAPTPGLEPSCVSAGAYRVSRHFTPLRKLLNAHFHFHYGHPDVPPFSDAVSVFREMEA